MAAGVRPWILYPVGLDSVRSECATSCASLPITCRMDRQCMPCWGSVPSTRDRILQSLKVIGDHDPGSGDRGTVGAGHLAGDGGVRFLRTGSNKYSGNYEDCRSQCDGLQFYRDPDSAIRFRFIPLTSGYCSQVCAVAVGPLEIHLPLPSVIRFPTVSVFPGRT